MSIFLMYYYYYQDSPPKVYAFVDSFEIQDDQVNFTLEAVDATQIVNGELESNESGISDRARPILLNFSVPNSELAKQFIQSNQYSRGYNFRGRNNRWIELQLRTEGDIPITFFADQNAEDNTLQYFVNESDITFVRRRTADIAKLDSLVNLSIYKESEQSLIESALSDFDRRIRNVHLNIYNVGQGSLSAICNNNQVPLLYFDLGGGFAWNRHTYPTTRALCNCNAEIIIISHWDVDHIETYRRYQYTNPDFFNNKIWIAPAIPNSIFYSKLAKRMASTGTLFIWPNSLKKFKGANFEVSKCRGKLQDKNHSGLALSIFSQIPTLHPADAAYKYVQSYKRRRFYCLIATHHGAEFPDSNNPIPRPSRYSSGSIVYSFGNGNSYGHPKQASVAAHQTSGWGTSTTYVKSTHIDGDISISHVRSFVRCTNPNCDVYNLTFI